MVVTALAGGRRARRRGRRGGWFGLWWSVAVVVWLRLSRVWLVVPWWEGVVGCPPVLYESRVRGGVRVGREVYLVGEAPMKLLEFCHSFR